MKYLGRKIMSLVLVLMVLVSMAVTAMPSASAGIVSGIITSNFTAIALELVERTTCTAVATASSAVQDEVLSDVLSWTSRILSGYQSVVNKTLIAETQKISQQLDDIYSLNVTEFAAINDKLNLIVQEDAGDDFNAVRSVVTDAGDKYQKMIIDFDDLLEKFVAYNNDPTDSNKTALETAYQNLCVDYKFELNVNNKDVYEEENFILPMTEGGFFKTVSPYSYNNSVYYNDEVNITDSGRWGTADNQRETYLDALFDYSSAVYNFENNVYDLMSAGVNEVADAVSMYVQAYRYYVDLNKSLVMADETLDEGTKNLLVNRLESHFEEYSLKAIRTLNQMCEEYREVFTTYMRTYDTVSTVSLKDYVFETTVKDAYSGYDVDSDIADMTMNTMWKHDRSTFDVYQFKLVNDTSEDIYAIKTNNGKTASESNYFPTYFGADTFSNKTGAFSLDVLNLRNGTTNGLNCISSLSDISRIYTETTAYKANDTLINNIRRELMASRNSVELELVSVTDANATAGAYLFLDTNIDWAGGQALFGNSYADMTWVDVSKLNPSEVVVDALTDVKEGGSKDSQLNIMFKGRPSVSMDVNAISANGVSDGSAEVYVGNKCVIGGNGSASGLTSSEAMTIRVTPAEDSYVSSIVLKNTQGATLTTVYSGNQDDYFAVCNGEGVTELIMPVPCQDTVLEVTYDNIIEEYKVTAKPSDENTVITFENSEETSVTIKEGETVFAEVSPAEGYKTGAVRAEDSSGSKISVNVTACEGTDSVQVSFVMPESDVTLIAGSYFDNGHDFVIHNYEELCEMRDNINAGVTFNLERGTVSANECVYVLANDIVCPEGESFTPVNVKDGFMGTLDGRGYTIENLTISDTSLEEAGFFTTIGTDGVVKNLNLENLNITVGTQSTAGGIATENTGTISDCRLSGTIITDSAPAFSEESMVVIGTVASSNTGKVTNCTSEVSVIAGDNMATLLAGGIIGMYVGSGEVSRCFYNGAIESDAIINFVGGIIGWQSGVISECGNNGDITVQGWVNAGGIAGYAYKGILSETGQAKIINCYNTGTITVEDYSSIYPEAASVYEQLLLDEGETHYAGGLCGNIEQIGVQGFYTCGEVIVRGEKVYGVTGAEGRSVVLENYYYLVAGGTSITEDAQKYMSAFASGEVAYLLNKGTTDGTQVWYQNLDNGEPVDASPKFEGGTVYESQGNCIGENKGYTNMSDSISHNYNNYHVCKDCLTLREGEAAGIYGFTIGLGGNISVQYYMVIDEAVAADESAKMVFTVPNGSNPYTVEIPVKDAETTTVEVPALGETRTLYVFECEVAAKEMASDIYCQIVTDTRESDSFCYTVKEYAEVILANPDVYSKEISLVKAMLNYGAEAQIAFGHNLDNLANTSDYITEEEKVLESVDFTPYAHAVEDSDESIGYYGSAISLKSETAIKHYFSFENPDEVENTVVKVDGKEAELKKNGTLYELKISDIPAHRLHENYEVKVGGVTLDYSVFSYCNSVSGAGNDNGFAGVAKAIYAYNRAAVAYVG